MFGIDKEVSISDEQVTVNNDGKQTRESLSAAELARIKALAAKVAALGDVTDTGSAGVDGGATNIEIEAGEKSSTVSISSGDDTPKEVWELLDEIEKLSPDY